MIGYNLLASLSNIHYYDNFVYCQFKTWNWYIIREVCVITKYWRVNHFSQLSGIKWHHHCVQNKYTNNAYLLLTGKCGLHKYPLKLNKIHHKYIFLVYKNILAYKPNLFSSLLNSWWHLKSLAPMQYLGMYFFCIPFVYLQSTVNVYCMIFMIEL